MCRQLRFCANGIYCAKSPGGEKKVRASVKTNFSLQNIRPHPGLLPQEKEKLRAGFGFADERPANPVARISKQTENDSPSPWGEGRDEGGREPFEIHNLNSVLETAKGIHFLNSFWMDD